MSSEPLSPGDYQAILDIQKHRGMQAVVRYCELNMEEIESMIFGDNPLVDPEGYIGLTREHRGLRKVRELILAPPTDEEEMNDE